MRNGPRFHIIDESSGYPLCNNRNLSASVNAADCQVCTRRLDRMMDVLRRLAEGGPSVGKLQVEAMELFRQMGYEVGPKQEPTVG